MKVLETNRLILRWLRPGDAEFLIRLLNEPSFLRYIGDRGVRNLADAHRYLLEGPLESYRQLGFGLYMVELKEGGVPSGLCGLLKREALADVDIGFAFLPQFWSQGYAFEAASAVMTHARLSLGLERVVAITSQDNASSARLLGKLGFVFERLIRLSDDEPELRLFAWGRA